MNIAIENKTIDEFLEDLADELQVPQSRYESAERSYQALGTWFHRKDSKISNLDPEVYVQGSFRLGTAIKPDQEDYDIDLVCRVSIDKLQTTQADVKKLIGDEVKSYAKSQGMTRPSEGNRCWTLHYADEANFHMDALPAIPDEDKKRMLVEAGPAYASYEGTAIAITDRERLKYRERTSDWLSSNPKAYALWFRNRMGNAFRQRALTEANRIRASVEDVPSYRVRTPLQSAIQILKHHRDVMFADRLDDKPISIIITTLASRSYEQEPSISSALFAILSKMDQFIEVVNGVRWVSNPTDPTENFADRWPKNPERETAFFEWLEKARNDFGNAAAATTRDTADQILTEAISPEFVSRARVRRDPHRKPNRSLAVIASIKQFLAPPHMRRPRWPAAPEGDVQIKMASFEPRGFRKTEFVSGQLLSKRSKLWFKADTNVPGKIKVYWQVVNTGSEADDAGCLRGGFDLASAVRGGLTKEESTLYTGQHSIECFIVKNGKLAARSGQFIVNIA